MSRINWDRPRGTVHNLQSALALRETGCNLLCLSDASLYVLQNWLGLDLEFKARWADEEDGTGYIPISSDSPNYADWKSLLNQIQEECTPMPCDILQDIYDLLSAGIIVKPEVWFAGGWREQPPVLGFLGAIGEEQKNLSAAAGGNFLYSSTVPSGEAWTIEQVAGTDLNSACGAIIIWVEYDGRDFVLLHDLTPVAAKWSAWTGNITLYAGSRVGCYFGNCTLNDDIYLRLYGRKSFSSV